MDYKYRGLQEALRPPISESRHTFTWKIMQILVNILASFCVQLVRSAMHVIMTPFITSMIDFLQNCLILLEIC